MSSLMTSENWLQLYLEESVRKNLCTQIYCTTCGAMKFRRGVLDALSRATGQQDLEKLSREAALEIAKTLAEVRPIQADLHKLVDAIRCLLFDLWSGIPILDREIEGILAGSWADDILRRMQEHHEAKQAERRAREEFESPEAARKRREEKKRLKQEQHRQRLALKKERDLKWREEHGGQS